MARPKGSKNKTRIVNANVDYAAVVAEKTAEKEKIESEVAALTANLDDLKTQLKAKKAELKAATKELAKAENKKAAAEAMNCTPFVRQYGILFRKWGVFVCQRDNESTTELKR